VIDLNETNVRKNLHCHDMSAAPATLSVVIPTRDEAANISAAIDSARRDSGVEVIVSDGGSRDRTCEIARSCGAKVISVSPGRARQMNAGARLATGTILLFLHADTRLPQGYKQLAFNTLAAPGTVAGAFALQIQSGRAAMRILAAAANFRSRALQTPYGDQALFLLRDTFNQIGKFQDLPIMEDVELTRTLRTLGHIRIVNRAVSTSSRRWDNHGVWRTTLLNQILVAAHSWGADAHQLWQWRESGALVRTVRRNPVASAEDATAERSAKNASTRGEESGTAAVLVVKRFLPGTAGSRVDCF